MFPHTICLECRLLLSFYINSLVKCMQVTYKMAKICSHTQSISYFDCIQVIFHACMLIRYKWDSKHCI